MYVLVSVLILLVCVILVLVVLVQNSKGGGLVGGMSSQNQMMGVRQTTDFLEKATWTLASALLVLSVIASVTIPRGQQQTESSLIEEQIQNAVDPQSLPNVPIQFEDREAPQPQEEE